MPRRNLILAPGQSVHVIRRGVARCAIFLDDEDRLYFMRLLKDAVAMFGTELHGFVMMDTHYHGLVTPIDVPSLSGMMKAIGEEHVKYFNRRHGRIGTLYTNAFTAIPIDTDRYWMTCLRYIDQNPVRAHIVDHPGDYAWSSYRAHAGIETVDWITDHYLYTALGETPGHRHAAYRAICGAQLTADELAVQRHPPSFLKKTTSAGPAPSFSAVGV